MTLQSAMNHVIAYALKLGLENPRADLQQYEDALYSVVVRAYRPDTGRDAVAAVHFRAIPQMKIEDYAMQQGCTQMDLLQARIATKH